MINFCLWFSFCQQFTISFPTGCNLTINSLFFRLSCFPLQSSPRQWFLAGVSHHRLCSSSSAVFLIIRSVLHHWLCSSSMDVFLSLAVFFIVGCVPHRLEITMKVNALTVFFTTGCVPLAVFFNIGCVLIIGCVFHRWLCSSSSKNHNKIKRTLGSPSCTEQGEHWTHPSQSTLLWTTFHKRKIPGAILALSQRPVL